MTRKVRAIALLPIVPIALVAGYVAWMVVDDDGSPADPVDIHSSGPDYPTLAELVDASDRVIEGEVVAVEHGRAITDPGDPTVGIVTQLATVATTHVAKGSPAATVVVEQEATLLDGTPVTVDGVSPLTVGDSGWFMLINGDGEQFPYTALTTPGAFVAGTSNATDELQQLVARGPVVEGSAVGVTRSG